MLLSNRSNWPAIERGAWQKAFAWHPVETSDGWIWLEMYEWRFAGNVLGESVFENRRVAVSRSDDWAEVLSGDRGRGNDDGRSLCPPKD